MFWRNKAKTKIKNKLNFTLCFSTTKHDYTTAKNNDINIKWNEKSFFFHKKLTCINAVNLEVKVSRTRFRLWSIWIQNAYNFNFVPIFTIIKFQSSKNVKRNNF